MITHFGLNNRDQVQEFQRHLLNRNSNKNSIFVDKMSTTNLGRNFSCFLWKQENKKLLVLLDVDDGSGGTPSDCKIVWSALNEILCNHRPHDLLVLKSQYNKNPEYNQFYPFKDNIVPIGIFSDCIKNVFDAKNKYPKKATQDIDVFYAGGYKHVKNRPYVWPTNRDIRKWWSGASVRGYEKLLEIKNKRTDINFAVFDKSLPAEQFYDYVSRSKVCIDLPGVGLSSRKFYEFMVFEKCVLSLQQQHTPWDCEENVHYCSMQEDLDFSSMEEKIDLLLKNEKTRTEIEGNVRSINSQLSLNSMITRVEKIIKNKMDTLEQRISY